MPSVSILDFCVDCSFTLEPAVRVCVNVCADAYVYMFVLKARRQPQVLFFMGHSLVFETVSHWFGTH